MKSPWYQPPSSGDIGLAAVAAALPESPPVVPADLLPGEILNDTILDKPQWSTALPAPQLDDVKLFGSEQAFVDRYWQDKKPSHWNALWLIIPLGFACVLAWGFGTAVNKQDPVCLHCKTTNVGPTPLRPKDKPFVAPVPVRLGDLVTPHITNVPTVPQSKQQETRVSFALSPGGSMFVVGRVNSSVYVSFAIDSGSDVVTIPPETYLALVRNGTITRSDMLPDQNFTMADGHVSRSKVFMLRSLQVGGLAISNVKASIGSNGEGLLGQTFLKRFKSWSIDNHHNELVLTYFYG